MVIKTSNTAASQKSTSRWTDAAIFYAVRAPAMSETKTLQVKTTRLARQTHYNVDCHRIWNSSFPRYNKIILMGTDSLPIWG